jgi:ribosomal protein S27E
MKKVNKYTRAGKEGRTIYCPECNAPNKVYHFSWSAITCGGCQQMIGKYYFSTKPRQWRSNQGRSPISTEQNYRVLGVLLIIAWTASIILLTMKLL